MNKNKAKVETVIAFEAGYEKGVRDMWEISKDKLSCMCDSWYIKNKCVFETCPIAQKLLKGVK